MERKRIGDLDVVVCDSSELAEWLTQLAHCQECGVRLTDDNPYCVCPDCVATYRAKMQATEAQRREAEAAYVVALWQLQTQPLRMH